MLCRLNDSRRDLVPWDQLWRIVESDAEAGEQGASGSRPQLLDGDFTSFERWQELRLIRRLTLSRTTGRATLNRDGSAV
jgi:hypothetical protein